MKLFGFDITNASKKQPEKARIMQKVIEQQLLRTRQDINKWKLAVQSAESRTFPNRRMLYECYQDVALDGHLSGLMELRKANITGKIFKIVDKSGETVDDKTKLLDSMWFFDFLDFALDSKFYGFSLIQFGDLDNDKFKDLEIVPREYVSPETGEVSNLPGVKGGIKYTESPYKEWSIGVGKAKDLGLLMKLSPYVIWKKGAIGAWSEASEMFGMPIRIGRTNIQDPEMKANMEGMLKNMGSAAWGVFDTSDILELLQTSKSDVYAIYDKLIERCNSEMSKIVLGHSASIDATAGKLGGEDNTHEAIESFIDSDKRFIRFVINDQLIPFLNGKGMGFDGLECVFDDSEEISVLDQFSIDGKLLDYYDIPEAYIEKTYGTDVKKKTQLGGTGMGKPQTTTTNLYAHLDFDVTNKVLNLFDKEEIDTFFKGIYAGLITTKDLPLNIYKKIAEYLTSGVDKGYNKIKQTAQLGKPDKAMMASLKENVYIFSGAKTYQQVKDLSSMVVGKDGNIKPYNEFKKEALKTFNTYNKNHLAVEYDLAVGQSQMASLWVDIERDKAVLPYLQYITIGDGHVRPTHASLDKIIRKVDDPFWDTYLPKNGWNCRCSVLQLAEGKETNMDNFKEPKDVPDMFKYNAGKEKIVFPKEHPYFDVQKEDVKSAKNNFNLPLP
jgi:SPP1 gp7 family putative phage head morphogenesis protein